MCGAAVAATFLQLSLFACLSRPWGGKGEVSWRRSELQACALPDGAGLFRNRGQHFINKNCSFLGAFIFPPFLIFRVHT